MIRRRFSLRLPRLFDLRLALHGHGWVSLPPHRWRSESETLQTALRALGHPIDVTVRQRDARLAVSISLAQTIPDEVFAEARAQVHQMLRIDEDLEEFWRLCGSVPRLHWAAQVGAGRLLRSPTVFEDLLKLLFTTNCSWAATTGMTERLVAALGEETASGQRTFPSAMACAARGEGFFRETVRAGYRARAGADLACAFAEERLCDADFTDPALATDELRRRLLALPGFGPYAAGQAMRLLGRYEDFALDSWCQTQLTEITGRSGPHTERSVARRYRQFGRYQGLALWLDLTADWHRSSRAR